MTYAPLIFITCSLGAGITYVITKRISIFIVQMVLFGAYIVTQYCL